MSVSISLDMQELYDADSATSWTGNDTVTAYAGWQREGSTQIRATYNSVQKLPSVLVSTYTSQYYGFDVIIDDLNPLSVLPVEIESNNIEVSVEVSDNQLDVSCEVDSVDVSAEVQQNVEVTVEKN